MNIRHVAEHIEVDTPKELRVLGIPERMKLFGNYSDGYSQWIEGNRKTFLSHFDLLMRVIRGEVLDTLDFDVIIRAKNPRYMLAIDKEGVSLLKATHAKGAMVYGESLSPGGGWKLYELPNENIRMMFEDDRINADDTRYIVDISHSGKPEGEDSGANDVEEDLIEMLPAPSDELDGVPMDTVPMDDVPVDSVPDDAPVVEETPVAVTRSPPSWHNRFVMSDEEISRTYDRFRGTKILSSSDW